ncbi:MAG TPA: ABC transporter substrate-binding protein [Longimicrobiales bacterium]|nr:ABC transporter substrate-binding protein [Longimicrobiales bacterium]
MFRDQSRYLLFLPLVTLEGLEVRPRLARSWEHSPDYRTWTFHLREDVRWHDGVPVTAHDIVFSLELFAHPDVLWAPGIRRDYDSISVPDDHTIIMHLKRPASPPPVGVPFRPWVVFFPKHLLQDLDPADFSEWDFWSRPVGNGPYRFVRRVPQTMFELGANPDFYAGEPSIQRVVLKLGGASPLLELRSGGADVALYVTPTEALKLATDPGFVLYHGYDWSELQAIYWNQRHPLLADAAVRRALSHAIDRRALARSLSYPEEMPFAGGVSNEDLEDHPYRHGGWDQGPAYDPGLAERLLRQVGWIDRDGNGVRERAGREARFTLVVNTAGGVSGLEQGILVQDQLRRVGVAVEIRPMELSAALDDLRRGDFEAMIHYVDNTPDGILVDWLGEPSPDGSEAWSGKPPPFGYRSPEAARLLRALYRERDLDAQDTLYHRINEIFRRDMPVTFLFPSVYVNAAHRRIRGIRRGWGWAMLQVPEELWIENEP